MRDLVQIAKAEAEKAFKKAARMIVRGMMSTAADSNRFFQTTGVDSSDVFEKVESFQHYGFSARAPTGTEAVFVNPGGQGSAAVSVAENNRTHRPDLNEGESCLHGLKATGQPLLKMRDNGSILMESGGAATGKLEIFSASGQVTITGPLSAIVDLIAAGSVNLVPGVAGFVNLGSAVPIDSALKGTTFAAALNTLVGSHTSAASTWSTSPKALGDIVAYINTTSAAWPTFFSAGGAGMINFVCIKTKVT